MTRDQVDVGNAEADLAVCGVAVPGPREQTSPCLRVDGHDGKHVFAVQGGPNLYVYAQGGELLRHARLDSRDALTDLEKAAIVQYTDYLAGLNREGTP